MDVVCNECVGLEEPMERKRKWKLERSDIAKNQRINDWMMWWVLSVGKEHRDSCLFFEEHGIGWRHIDGKPR